MSSFIFISFLRRNYVDYVNVFVNIEVLKFVNKLGRIERLFFVYVFKTHCILTSAERHVFQSYILVLINFILSFFTTLYRIENIIEEERDKQQNKTLNLIVIKVWS